MEAERDRGSEASSMLAEFLKTGAIVPSEITVQLLLDVLFLFRFSINLNFKKFGRFKIFRVLGDSVQTRHVCFSVGRLSTKH